MNDIQTKLAELKSRGWTYAAIADELDLTSDAVEKWKAGNRKPHGLKTMLIRLEQIGKKKPPKQRRYAKGSRTNSKKERTDGQP